MEKPASERKNGKKTGQVLIVTSRYAKVDIPINGDKNEGKTEKFDKRNRKVVTRFLPADLIQES